MEKQYTPAEKAVLIMSAFTSGRTLAVFELCQELGISNNELCPCVQKLLRDGKIFEVSEKINPRNKKGVRAYNINPRQPVVVKVRPQSWLSPVLEGWV